jgi:hypothetical protein
MKNMQASLERLRADAAEAALLRDLATDSRKRELFTKLADHFATLAAEVELAIAAQGTDRRSPPSALKRRASMPPQLGMSSVKKSDDDAGMRALYPRHHFVTDL